MEDGLGTRVDEVSRTVEDILAYQAGDDRVLQELFGRYYPRVLQIVRIRMGPRLRKKEGSGDLVNLTFIEAIEGLKRVRPHGSGALIHWLATVAENVIRGRLDYWNAKKRNPDLEVAMEALSRSVSSGEFRVDLPAEVPTPEDHASAREDLQRLIDCMGDLPDDYREVLILLRVAGADHEYAAKVLNRSKAAVSTLLGRAAARLAVLMDQRERGS